MSEIDKRGKLEEKPFDFQITKDQRVLIYWDNRLIMTLKGDAAKKLIAKLDTDDESAIQMALALVPAGSSAPKATRIASSPLSAVPTAPPSPHRHPRTTARV